MRIITRIFPLSLRAFSLIEAAIVLALVGVVLGGIWVAASSISKQQKINQTVEGLIVFATAIQNVMSLTAGAQMGCCPNITPVLVASAGIPAGWSANATNTQLTTPTGSTAGGSSFGNRMDFVIDNMNQEQCIKFISAVTGSVKTSGTKMFSGVTVYTNSYGGPVTLSSNPSTWPIVPTTSQCVSGINTVNFITLYIFN